MQGRRVDVEADADPWVVLRPGDFGRWHRDGCWYVRPPRNAAGASVAGRLTTHRVEEHGDGSITVAPSILQRLQRSGDDTELWHGWLERGVWRSC